MQTEFWMRWNHLIRQSHRWVSIAFTVAVALNFVALGLGMEPPPWVYAFVLLPLFFLMFSGLYLFVLPYLAKPRATAP